MTYHIRDMRPLIAALKAAKGSATTGLPLATWECLPDAHNCKLLADMNATRAARSRTRAAIIAVSVLFGMALAGLVYSNAYARAADAVANPHHEGF